MKLSRYRYVFWLELTMLILLVCLLIFPIKFGYTYAVKSHREIIELYYALSAATLLFGQTAYMWPIRTFFIRNYLGYFTGMGLFVLSVWFWWSEARGRTLDFSELSNGEVTGPIVFAIGCSAIHGFTHVIYTKNIKTELVDE